MTTEGDLQPRDDRLSRLHDFIEADEDVAGVEVLGVGQVTPGGAALMIVVHPGDVVEHPHGWGQQDVDDVIDFSLDNQAAQAEGINERLATHHAIVLHRVSSIELRDPGRGPYWVDEEFAQAVTRASLEGNCLYGDDLDAAAALIAEHHPLRAGQAVWMTGAYADREHGCITALGKALLAIEPGLRIEVDSAAPTDNCNGAPRWDPSVATESGENVRAQGSRVAP